MSASCEIILGRTIKLLLEGVLGLFLGFNRCGFSKFAMPCGVQPQLEDNSLISSVNRPSRRATKRAGQSGPSVDTAVRPLNKGSAAPREPTALRHGTAHHITLQIISTRCYPISIRRGLAASLTGSVSSSIPFSKLAFTFS